MSEQMTEKQMAELQELREADRKRKDSYKVWGERYRVRMILFKEKAEKAGIRVSDEEVDKEIVRRAKK